MNSNSILFALILLFACKSTPQTEEIIAGGRQQLKADIQYLASDELAGRDTGTEGELLAAEYIVARFQALGLEPAGDDDTYYQPFSFTGTPILSGKNQITISGRTLENENYFPVNWSGSGDIDARLIDVGFGIVDVSLGVDDIAGKELKGRIALMDVSSPDGIHPHSAYLEHHDLRPRVERLMEAGASAVLLHSRDSSAQPPSQTLTENVDVLDIPVIWVDHRLQGSEEVTLSMHIERPVLQGKNVAALLNKGKRKTIVIGAHYDHLGHGISGSLHRGASAIHNGADDNASGVAAMLQIALDLRADTLQHNVLFIGFSGEERGLLGSNHYVKNPTISLDKMAYMLNMDMVGRLDSTKNKVSINGVGTSPAWDFIDSTLVIEGLHAVTTESGTGPSDHMSFYLSDIPVLHFFSGTHADYHKPSDDEELINYDGIERIIAYMEHIIHSVDDLKEIPFTKTKSEKKEAAAFKVTLGVVPDYLYEDKGMRIDGVSEGRPGQKAGLMKGDIILGMGTREIGDIYAYMEGLAEHEPGQTTSLRIQRKGQALELSVTFD